MHSDSVFSPPRYYKSFTCPNKVSLLLGSNTKLVPHSRNICLDYKKSLDYFSILVRQRILPEWSKNRKIYYRVLTLHFALTFIDEVIAPL